MGADALASRSRATPTSTRRRPPSPRSSEGAEVLVECQRAPARRRGRGGQRDAAAGGVGAAGGGVAEAVARLATFGTSVISMRRFFAMPSGVRVRRDRIVGPVARRRERRRVDALRREQLHDRDGARRRELPVRREELLLVRRDGLRCRCGRPPGSAWPPTPRSVAATSASAVLPAGFTSASPVSKRTSLCSWRTTRPCRVVTLRCPASIMRLNFACRSSRSLPALLRLLHRALGLLELRLLVVGHRLRLRHAELRS